MTTTLEAANDAMRKAVATRMAATPADDPKLQGYRGPSAAEVIERFSGPCESAVGYKLDQGDPEPSCCEGRRFYGHTAHVASLQFFALCDRLKEMHANKSRDYGSETDPLANIRNGAEFVGIEPWKGAMVRLSDKVTRLATYNRTGSLTFEGVEDTLLDLASYSLLALLLYREENQT